MKSFLMFVFLVIVATTAVAQDRFRFNVHYDDSRIPFTEKDKADKVKGFGAEADVKLFQLGVFRGSAAYEFQQLYNVEVYPNYFDGMNVVDLYRNVSTHYAGGQLGLNLKYAVEPFVGYFVGTNKVHENANRQVVSKLRVGLNVPFTKTSKFYAKAALDFDRSYGTPNHMEPMPLPAFLPAGGFVSPDTRRVIIGIGGRF